MIKKIALPILSALMISSASASIVAVIDSGTDINHPDLKPYLWVNPLEQMNNLDDDNNSFIDDLYGWNLVNNNNILLDQKRVKYFDKKTTFTRVPRWQKIGRFFDIQAKMEMGSAGLKDIIWALAKSLSPIFLPQVSEYGELMHGTHVAGIAIKDNPKAQLLTVKLLGSGGQDDEDFEILLTDESLQNLAKYLGKDLIQSGEYVGSFNADIANGSFGTGYPQAVSLVKMIHAEEQKKLPEDQRTQLTPEEVHSWANKLLSFILDEARKMVDAAPDTLFVFAAGNDGLNNDIKFSSPCSVGTDNSISVAALADYTRLASFSNFGVETVDVAAPGVGIRSTAPSGHYMAISGTSQASPFVANVASLVKDTNPNLDAKQIKDIILSTVDKKAFLKDKIRSGGIVNKYRAIKAAELSKTMPLELAIENATTQVADVRPNSSNKSLFPLSGFSKPVKEDRTLVKMPSILDKILK